MDTRIGYPNEHLAGDSDDTITSPLFATAVGLVMDGLKRQDRKKAEAKIEEAIQAQEEAVIAQEEATQAEAEAEIEKIEPPKKQRKSFLDTLTDRVKDFLDNAE